MHHILNKHKSWYSKDATLFVSSLDPRNSKSLITNMGRWEWSWYDRIWQLMNKKVNILYGVFCLEFQSLQEESRIESKWSTAVIKMALHNFYLSTSNMYCLQRSCTLSVSSYPLCFLQLSLAGCNFLIGMWNTLLCFLKQNVNLVTHGK